jgi:hypothetical protein
MDGLLLPAHSALSSRPHLPVYTGALAAANTLPSDFVSRAIKFEQKAHLGSRTEACSLASFSWSTGILP